MASQASPTRAGRAAVTIDRCRPQRTAVAAVILVAFLTVAWFAAPPVLPLFFQRLVGVTGALLAALVAVFAVREFGKRYNRLRLPWLGRISTSQAVGIVVFLAVLAWWLSPWAPIKVLGAA
jgi:hypothetical protein